jgi:hypothetical protein
MAGFFRSTKQKGNSMRMLRSLVCASLAMMAIGLCAAMPASASVPIETVHVIAKATEAVNYPAPATTIVCQDVAALPREAPNIEADGGSRSSLSSNSSSVAFSYFTPLAYQHIDPDITG